MATTMRVPKYYALKGELLRLIEGATVGTMLPTERELAERFAVSRTTVRQAIAELARRGSLYRTLADAYGVDLRDAEDVVETALASPVEAQLLGVENGLPMLLIRPTARDGDGRPVEHTRSVFRGDRFRFVAHHRR